jgi:E3 ubiquitin-protein ligase DOA10
MMSQLTKQIIADVCYIAITTIAGIASYYFKKLVNSKKDLNKQQKEALKQQIGDAQYNKDVNTAKRIVMSVEQMGKEFDWEGAIKHSKATEMISQKTGLSSGDIFDIIKATVAELNKDKDKKGYSLDPVKKSDDNNQATGNKENVEAPGTEQITPGASN